MVLEAQEDNVKHGPNYYNVTCPVCGKKFHLKPSKLRIDHNHYCSRECHYKAKQEYMLGPKNHQYGLLGELNPTWKGGRRISNYGYWEVLNHGHPFAREGNGDYMFEHRLVAEQYLLTDENSVEIDGKHYLSPDYMVHHKNGNRLDNRPENLEVMTKSEHSSLHAREYNKYRKRDELGRFLPDFSGDKVS